MNPAAQRLVPIWQIALVSLGVICATGVCLYLGPGGTGVLASMRLADGSEYMVTQRFNWSSEPYTVEFFMRSAAGPWGWCYIDHEAWRWRRVVMSYDAASDAVVVTERGTRRVVLDRKRSAFWMDNGSFSRELPAPQSIQKPKFSM